MAELRYLQMLRLGFAYLEAHPDVDAITITLLRRRLDEFEERCRRSSTGVHRGFSIRSLAAPARHDVACDDVRRC